MQLRTKHRRTHRIICRAAFAIFFLIASVGQAQETLEKKPWLNRNWKPAPLQINQFFGQLLLCDMSGASISAKSQSERDAVLTYINDNLLSSSKNEGPTRVDFSAFGVNFTSIFVGGGGDGAGASTGSFAYSDTGTVDTLVKALRAHGLLLGAENMDVGARQLQQVLTATKITTDDKHQWIVAKGEIYSVKDTNLKGVTLTCLTSSPTDAEVQAATGLPSARSISRRVLAGENIPKDVIDQVIQRGGPNAVQYLAGYQSLDTDQIAALIAYKRSAITRRLLNNKRASLSAHQVNQLIDADELPELLALIATRYEALNAAQREQLARRSSVAPYMTVRAGDAAAVELLTRLIKDGDGGRFSQLLAYFPALNDAVVNLILNSGTPTMRTALTMNSAFNYNAEQKEAILLDADRAVQIGLLRRKDVKLTTEQVARGINHPDKDLAFWYRQVKGYAPTAEQIEIGLTSSDAPTRAGWALNERIALMPSQAQRGLADTSAYIVAIFLQRGDISLTEANRDACTSHPDVSVRFACVKRADYTLTQKRFEQIATDANSNVLRMFLERKNSPAVDLNPFFDEALRSASESALLAIAANSALPLTPEQIKRVPAALTSPQVEQAFARRMSSALTIARQKQ